MIETNREATAFQDTLAHYQIIRRSGAVALFEPQPIVAAMIEAFLCMSPFTSEGEVTRRGLSAALRALFSPVSTWRGQIKLQERQGKTAISGQGARMQQRARPGLHLRVGSGLGFFSALKPNLRNAP